MIICTSPLQRCPLGNFEIDIPMISAKKMTQFSHRRDNPLVLSFVQLHGRCFVVTKFTWQRNDDHASHEKENAEFQHNTIFRLQQDASVGDGRRQVM